MAPVAKKAKSSSANATPVPAHLTQYSNWMTSSDSSGNTFPTNTVTMAISATKGGAVYAKEDIKEGTIVFRIPKTLCYGVGLGAPESDSQVALVTSLLKDQSTKQWKTRLQMLIREAANNECTVAFCWPAADLKLLNGTELERVVAAKLQRLHTEYGEADLEEQGVSFEYYKQLCGVALSHVNPWWDSTCICPMNDLLNYESNVENISFDVDDTDDEFLVGVATMDIKEGVELTQSYCESHADLIFRYGFVDPNPNPAMMEGDVVSIAAVDFIKGLGIGGKVVAERMGVLTALGLMQESPWDGVSEVTAEIGVDGGVWEVVAAVVLLQVEEGKWKEVVKDVHALGDEAATVLLARVGGADLKVLEKTVKQARLEIEVDLGDEDEESADDSEEEEEEEEDEILWPVLLANSGALTERVVLGAHAVFKARRGALLSISDKAAGDRLAGMARRLGDVERGILDGALDQLNSINL